MPEQTDIPTDDPAAAESEAPSSESSLLGRLKVLLLVAIVIAGECAVAYLYLPSASDTVAMAKATMNIDEETGDPLAEEAPLEEEPSVDQVEVDLEEFHVTAYQAVSNTTLRIDFHLWGMVDLKDEAEFLRLMEENRQRFHEQVQVTIRSAEITDLSDPGLGLIKRKILERANRTLGKPLLRAIVFPNFSLLEQ